MFQSLPNRNQLLVESFDSGNNLKEIKQCRKAHAFRRGGGDELNRAKPKTFVRQFMNEILPQESQECRLLERCSGYE